MARKIFVNLPVADLQRSIRFFSELGFDFNSQFTDDTAACMIVAEDSAVMLLTKEKFAAFTPLPVSDAKKQSEVLVCFTCDSRSEVDGLTERAAALGATIPRDPEDYGFMYNRAFADLDGHIWELVHMDMNNWPNKPANQ